jgi:alpha-2-macroglobulin
LIRFKAPLIPLESLESPEQQSLLQKFELTPALPGQFRFLTPRMVGFAPSQALPQATRVRITLKAGLADLSQHRLDQDLAWTFNTEPIKLTDLPGITDPSQVNEDNEPIALKPTLKFTANTELDLSSVQQHLKLIRPGSQNSFPVTVALAPQPESQTESQTESEESAPEKFDPSQRDWVYTLTPQSDLEKGQRLRLEFEPGLRPLRGNLPSQTPFSSSLQTYAPLAFKALDFFGQPDADGAFGRFQQGRAELRFNNGLVAASVKQHISVSPTPKSATHWLRAYDGDRLVTLNPWAFEPNQTYTLTLGAELRDQFGQTLGRPVKVEYKTGDLAPDFWAPTGLNIFPAGQDLQLNLSAVNLPQATYQAAYRVIQPEDLVYTDSATPENDRDDLLPPIQEWQSYAVPKPQPNQITKITVPLREKLGGATGMLAYGVQARTHTYPEKGQQKWRQAQFHGLVGLTNLGVFSQWFPGSGLVRVHHLRDGSAAAGATVMVYESQLEAKTHSQPIPCATGKTDKSGLWVGSRTEIAGCLAKENGNLANPPPLLVIAQEGQDWTFARVLEYSGAYGYGIDAGWNGGKPESRGTIFSDRQLYQPGESAEFTAAAYYLQDGTLIQDKNAPYQVSFKDPNGKTIELGTQTTNEFGTFSLQVAFKPDQPLGYYSIRAKGEGEKEIEGEFRVAEFKPPNFKVGLALATPFAKPNQTLQAKAQSNYLFGPPVQGAEAKFYITRQPLEFTPQGWQQFSFGRRWFWPEKQPQVPTDVLQSTQALDTQGQGSADFKIASDLPYPMTYRVDVQVADVSNLSVADSQILTALPSDRLIGLKSEFVGIAGKPLPISVIVTDPTGKAIAGENLRLELQQIKYSSVTQVVEGSPTPRDQVEYTTVAKTEVRSLDQPLTAQLTPPDSGAYRIRANFANTQDDRTATDSQIWVTGTTPVFWGDRYQNNRLEIKLDKDRYQPGETATALIQSPYEEAELYFAVIRHKVLYQTVQTVRGSAPQIQFPVSSEMLPNAAVEAVLVRRGKPLSQLQPGNLQTLASIGFAPFKTDLKQRSLQVEVTPTQGRTTQPMLQPGQQQTLQFQLQNLQGQPRSGQLTVMVVNEAVLQLTGYRPPNLLETVYAEQPISTRFADNYSDLVLEPLTSPLEKGWGFGGGFSAGSAGTRIRTNFKPLAYYNGSLRTDAQGKAEVTFTLPDDLTTWRVMVVATDDNLRFGQGESTFMTSKPLVANPVLPQFVRPGDRFEAGLAVTNNSGQGGTLEIEGKIMAGKIGDNPESKRPPNSTPQTRPALAFADSPTVSLQTPWAVTPAAVTQAYRFPILAQTVGESQIQFRTVLGNQADGFAVPLAVKPYTLIEQVVESGVTANQVKIPLNIGQNVIPDLGGLEISLASTLIPEIKAPVKQVLAQTQLPFLEPAASQLGIAANLQQLGQTYPQSFADFDPAEQATQALAQLQTLQRPNGGFASWPDQEQADPFTTPYAAEAIAEGMTSFPQNPALQLDSRLIIQLKTYLSSLLANPDQNSQKLSPVCKLQLRLNALIALNALGDRRTDYLVDLFEQRANLDPLSQIKLARYLSQFPEWQPEAKTLSDQIQQTLYQTGRTTAVNFPQGWAWLETPTVRQAQALQLLIAQQAPAEQLDRLLQGLLQLRRQGTWGSTYANAEALRALVAYSQLQPTPPNFTAIAQLGSKKLTSVQFQGYQTPSIDLNLPMSELSPGRQELRLQKSGTGQLHYLTAYRYRPQGMATGRMNGLRISRSIRAANQTPVLQTLGLAQATTPLSVQPGQVFDIGLEMITDHAIDHLVITDPLPAGFEAVDTSFQTATDYFQPLNKSWQIDYQTIYHDRIVAYGDRLEAGVYTLHYLVRAVTPGTFSWPGAEAHLQYAPEEFGRSTSAQLLIK